MGKNLTHGKLEIDLLTWEASTRSWVIIEVRGRSEARFLPSDTLSQAKKRRLYQWAENRLRGEKYRLELWELLGEIPSGIISRGVLYVRLFLNVRAGLVCRRYELT